MNIFTDIARRYLYSKKSTNAINIITGISVLGISIGTAALITILSVFNGFESLIKDYVDDFNPDLKIIPSEGKRFEVSDSITNILMGIEGIQLISQTLEEVALFEYDGIQEAGVIKGVDESFALVTAIDSTIRQGQFTLVDKIDGPLHADDNIYYAVPGYGLASKLSMNVDDQLTPLTIYLPRRKKRSQLDRDFITKEVLPKGFFSIQSEKDQEYVLTSLDLVEKLLKTKGSISALELKLDTYDNSDDIKKEIQNALGESFKVQDRYDQEESYFKVMKIEKWLSYLMGSLTILLIAFNLIGCLWMIVLDKKKDIAILRSLGSTANHIRELFLKEGLMITLVGLLFGIVLAVVIYFLQVNFGIISMTGSHIVEAYPIKLRLGDFLLVVLVVLVIGFAASWLPAKKATKIPAMIREE